MIHHRAERVRLLPLALSTVAAALAVSLGVPAQAEGAKLEAKYTASLTGLPVGRGSWTIDIGEDQFTAVASGSAAGLLRLFSTGHGTSQVHGAFSNGNFVASVYASSITTNDKSDEVRLTMQGNFVKDAVVIPPVIKDPDLIPIKDVHRHDVRDPMTAALMLVPGHTSVVGPDACNRVLPVFDGRMRYDIKLAFKRFERVKADKGYEGPVAVCAAYFTPVAGYFPEKAAIQYLIKERDMEIWLAPIADTRVVVPYRISVPTPLGSGVLEATEFVATPKGATALKTQ